MLTNNYLIFVLGGEPSVNLKLSELYKYALKNRIPVLILSNGAKFVPEIATGLKENLFSIILSPDAGSKEVFLAVKGVDYFNRTWETINDYSSLGSNNVSVKFILEYGNLSDIENMISKCVDCHVKDVILSFNCYLLNKCDLTDFKIAARKFAKLCSENSLNLSVPLGYVPIELYEETLIKYDIPFISAISEIKGDVYFWGASAFLRNFLSRKKLSSNLSIKGVIDQDNGKNLTKVEHLTVFSKEILNKLTNSTTIVIAVTHHQEEIKASIEKLLKEADLSNVKVITWL